MSLLSSASRASKVVKNVGRMREILGAMSRFGFGALVARMGLKRFGSRDAESSANANLPVAERLRLLIEGLGPSFIKIGQIVANRPDLVPPDIVREFSKLQDQVPALPFTVLKPLLEAELGRTLAECYSSFDTEALASASIAQVHAARTLDGDEVVVKILKPDVEKTLSQDFEILELLAELLEKSVPELRPFRLKTIVTEFKRSLLTEVNFSREANNIRRFRENFSNSAFLVVPKVYADLSSRKVITMERLRGVKLNDVAAVRSMGVDTTDLLRQGMDCFYQSILVDGFFHGDPHGGNILVLPDGRMGLIDFGSVGMLTLKARNAIINMFLALVAEDYEALVWEYLLMSPPGGGSRSTNKLQAIYQEVATLFSPYHGLPLKEIPAGKILLDATSVAFRHHVSLPSDLVLVFKSIVTLDGIGRLLDPEFDLVSAATKYSTVILKERYDPKRIGNELLLFMRDLSRFMELAPRQASEILRQIESGEFSANIRLPGLDRHSKSLSRSSSKLIFSGLSLGIFAVGAYLLTMPVLPYVLTLVIFGIGASLTALAVIRTLRD